MTKEGNIFLAKKLISELVYNAAYIEGCNVTFLETQAIIDGAKVSGIAAYDIETVINLKNAWQFLLSNLEVDLNRKFICDVNDYVSRGQSIMWGVLRNGKVSISGTKYIPEIPEKAKVDEALAIINKIQDHKMRGLELFCTMVRGQYFWDGNKRAATIVANKELINNGVGVLTIGVDNALDFNKALLNYYNDENEKKGLLDVLEKSIKSLEL
ncbi:MAG: hypothetical protein ACRCUS_02275 [Anaerovoracaceae bacterium]